MIAKSSVFVAGVYKQTILTQGTVTYSVTTAYVYNNICVTTAGANTLFNRAGFSPGARGPPRKTFWMLVKTVCCCHRSYRSLPFNRWEPTLLDTLQCTGQLYPTKN